MTRLTILTITTALLAPLAGCGGGASGAFSSAYPDNRPADVQAVLARLQSAPVPTEPAIVVTLGKDPAELRAIDPTTGETLWKQPVDEPRSAPRVAGRYVVLHEASGVVVRDAAGGQRLATVEDEAMHLAGADGEGALALLTLSTGGGVGAHSKLVLVEEGDVAWETPVDHAVGAPAVRAGLAFVPWGNQNLTVLDLLEAEEIARVRLTDGVVGHAFARGRDVYLGQHGVFRFTSALASGSKADAAYFEPNVEEALGELPGRPGFMRDAYAPPPGADSAVHRIRLDWRPGGEGESLQLGDGTLYLVFYEVVFGLDPDSGEVQWVRSLETDVVGASAQPGGLLVADAKGRLLFIGADDGRLRWEQDTGAEAVAARFRVADMAPEGAPRGQAQPLREQLVQAAKHSDARLVPARVLAVKLLSEMEAPEVTATLVDLCDDDRAPEAVREAACGRLAARTTGAEHVLEALDRHAAFLEGTTPPPVGPLATAAVRMKTERAVPKLIAHLEDPATPTEDLVPLLTAIGKLGDEDAAEPVADFLRLYHADQPAEPLIKALGVATQTLVALQGSAARELLVEIQDDPLGIPQVRGYARRAIAAIEEAEQQAAAEEAAEEQEEGEQDGGGEPEGDEAEQAEGQQPQLPLRITTPIVEKVLEPVMDQLRTCLLKADGKPHSARIQLMLSGEGDIERLSIRPAGAAECIEPLVRGQNFPGNRRQSRQRVIYTLRR